MTNSFNESRLQIVAAQLASIRAQQPPKGFLLRVAGRIRRDFLQKGWRDKARFVKFAARESAMRLSARLRRKRPSRIQFDLPPNQLAVAVRCNGGLGDLVIYSALLDRFFRDCGGPIIHVVVHPLRIDEARFVFHRAPAVALVTDEADLHHESTPYDIVLTLGDFPSYDFVRTERLERVAPEVLRKLKAARQVQEPYRTFIDAQPIYDGLFATAAAQSGLRRLDLLGWLGNVHFAQHHQLLTCPDASAYGRFQQLELGGQPYITVHNGWDNVAHRNTPNATKGWPVAHYEQFVAGFKRRFPHVLVVQLGAKTSRPIAGIDLGLLENTTLHEAAWILKHSLLHVDGDSGLVHLARALHTKSLVLFGPTNHEFFSYTQNETCFSTVCGNCWWSTNTWMQSCPRGLREAVCMKSIEPAEVLARAEMYLRSIPAVQMKIEDVRRCERQDVDAADARDAEFDAWRAGFIRNALQTAESADNGLRVAIVEEAGWATSMTVSTGRNVRTFSFAGKDGIAEDSPGIPASDVRGKLACDYGSLFNIPAESETFDVVVMPLLTDRTGYLYAAIKESLRILAENGLLVLTYRGAHILAAALDDLEADCRVELPAVGGIVLRKLARSERAAETNSRAAQTVGV